jgi:hypothetical protein
LMFHWAVMLVAMWSAVQWWRLSRSALRET